MLRESQLAVRSCFSLNHDLHYQYYCRRFKKSYLELKISVSSKVHEVFLFTAFCQKVKKDCGFNGESHGICTGQFLKNMADYKVPDTHPIYTQNLLQAVQNYNSRNIVNSLEPLV